MGLQLRIFCIFFAGIDVIRTSKSHSLTHSRPLWKELEFAIDKASNSYLFGSLSQHSIYLVLDQPHLQSRESFRLLGQTNLAHPVAYRFELISALAKESCPSENG